MCRFDQKQGSYKSLGNTVEFYAFDVYTEILEVSIRSNEVCQKTGEKLQTIIRFYCNPTKSGSDLVNSFNFESEFEDCIYTFDWPTKLLCVKEKWLNESTTPEKTGPTSTASNQPSTTTRNPITSSANKIPSFVVILLIIVILSVIVLILNNLPALIEKKYCRLFRKCCGRMCSWNWIFDCFESLDKIAWFGRIRRKITPRRRQRVQGLF